MNLPGQRGAPVDSGERPVDFGLFVRTAAGTDGLVVQPRMGFGTPAQMRTGLLATKLAPARTVGTLTLDSFTRVGELAAVEHALRNGIGLNGYPIVSYPDDVTRSVLKDVRGADFPVQVRHGSAVPMDIFASLVRLRLNATEGGPVSYCLPYGRTPLAESVANWEWSTLHYARLLDLGIEPHLETFGGCMLGQLCPPSQLIAISLLEALFFHRHGVRSLSLSYAQQTSHEQDREAVLALRELCTEFLPTDNWHIVVYAYMGVFPETESGAYALLGDAARLAVETGAARLIVKTVAESRRIPTVADNVAALAYADAAARGAHPLPVADGAATDSRTYSEACSLVEAVLNLDADIGRALLAAFRTGLLDIPYCVHPDNAQRSRSYIDADGRLEWADTGRLALGHQVRSAHARTVTAAGLLGDLSYIRMRYDEKASGTLGPGAGP
ncbi:methylaspartate mutase [Streptomyces sp. NBC_01754]|uniref:methylaspartate mutase n=1 Tax=Streptomyces sp. NBC_01754 TaxID=2975930 RepID=UPI002DD98D97|nr:methylaspartate mutase [Streptomyces sp. NBC_01754]WSC94325.1 methylaspartate mutase [Streptomyces sp. NBC_01754]